MLKRVFITLYISVVLVIKEGVGDNRQGAAISGFTPEDITALLASHNEFRRQRGSSDMRVLTWNTDLEGMAQGWVDTCTFGHNPDTKDRFGFSYVGENFFISQADTYEAEESVEHWHEEIHNYYLNNLTCMPSKVCGHFTQVVWAASYVLGCGIKWCNAISNSFPGFEQGLLIVCNYGPAGNLPGANPYVPGPACSQCPAEAQICSDGLCAISVQPQTNTTTGIKSLTESTTSSMQSGTTSTASSDSPTQPTTTTIDVSSYANSTLSTKSSTAVATGSGIPTTTDTTVQLVTNPPEPPTQIDFETEIIQTFVIFAFVAVSVSVCSIFNTLRNRFSRKVESSNKLSNI